MISFIQRLSFLLSFGFLSLVVQAQGNGTTVLQAPNLQPHPSPVFSFTGSEALTPMAMSFGDGLPTNLLSMMPDLGTSEIIGTSFYDLQSNASVSNRTVGSGSDLSATWTMSQLLSPFDDRGTGYNHYNGLAWDAQPAERLESVRTGWPAIVQTGAGTEVVVSHEASADFGAPLRVMIGQDGTWQESAIPNVSYAEDGSAIGNLWPRSAVGGTDNETVHVICITTPTANGGQLFQGQDGALLYYRSLDNGVTWLGTTLTELDSSQFLGFEGDTYAIHARGETVAFAVFNDLADSFVMISEDNGASWVKRTLVDFPVDLYVVDQGLSSTEGVDYTGDGVADEYFTSDGAGTVHVDAFGVVHCVYGGMYVEDNDLTDGTSSYFPGYNGLHHWRSDFMDGENQVIGAALDLNENFVLDLTDDLPAYYLGLASMPSMASSEDGSLYVSYSAIVESLDQGSQNYRHVYLVNSQDGGDTWNLNSPCDLTPFGSADGYECVFASLSPDVDGYLELTYQRDNEPGLNVRGDLDPISLNEMVHLQIPVADALACADLTGCTVPSACNYNEFALVDDGSCVYGPCYIWSDDFEGYPTGTYIAIAGAPDWNTWTAGNEGTEMDSQISDEQSVSGTQSMKIYSDVLTGGPMDILYVAGESGQLEFSFNLLVPSGSAGYYNFQESATAGLNWAFECTIGGDGMANFVIDGVDYGGFMLDGSWVHLSHLIDTQNDVMNVYLDGQFVLQLPYDGTEFGGANFYAAGDGVAYPLYYVDDVELYEAESVLGCMDPVACNYNPEAMVDDASCTYPWIYDCDEACINDSDGDGVCDELEIEGCGVSAACNYDPFVTDPDITLCVYPGDLCDDGDPETDEGQYNDNCLCVGQGPQGGCTNPNACNFDIEADYSDGSCLFEGDACDDGDPTTTDDVYTESCACEGVATTVGCINGAACNYNPIAVESDGSCLFPGDPCDDGDATTTDDAYNVNCECAGTPPPAGCINPVACNYDSEAEVSDGSCLFPGDPCDDGDVTTAGDTYDDNCGCVGEPSTVGCTDAGACNYNPIAEDDDGSCEFPGDPCDDGDPNTSNDALNDSCECEGEVAVAGCINPNACNYNPEAEESDGSCLFPGDPCDDGDASTSNDMYTDSCDCEGEGVVVGCINPNACNYNPEAEESDGSCLFPGDPCDDGDASTSNDMYTDSCDCQGELPDGVTDQEIEVALFPNPVRDWLNVTLEGDVRAALVLHDLTGRQVQTWSTIGSTKLDLRHLPSGHYVLSILSNQAVIHTETIAVISMD